MYTGTPLKAVKGEAKANEIKAITGATVSSKGVCDSINKVLTKDLIEALAKKSTQNSTEIESNAK
jgi:Na+-transporting NADH:ubiquinone oxidoreductase subunit NqrC